MGFNESRLMWFCWWHITFVSFAVESAVFSSKVVLIYKVVGHSPLALKHVFKSRDQIVIEFYHSKVQTKFKVAFGQRM